MQMDSRIKKNQFGYWEIVNKPTNKELQQYYTEKYYQEAKGSYELQYSQSELSFFEAKLEQKYAVLEKYVHKKGKMLDVGCGEGYALSFFRKKGWTVTGFDFSSAGIKSKNSDCLDALCTGDVFELLDNEIKSGRRYDVIWLQNVLEHVIDPISLLYSIKSLLLDDGIAVITVPNDCSNTQMNALNLGHIKSAFWVAPPDHLAYFDYQSLLGTAKETGWNCLEMLGDFPIDWFLFNPNSNYINDKSLGKSAHNARVQIENLLHQQPIESVIKFWAAAAEVGVGRAITAFLTPAVNHDEV